MIYITGDIHGEVERFDDWNLNHYDIHLTARDTVIICGDFGLPWDERMPMDEEAKLDFLDSLPCAITFIDGNHENFDLLKTYPTKAWNGGQVQVLRDHVLHLLRGEIYTIEGKTFFCFGGAKSTDRQWRIQGKSWWPEESLNVADFDNAVAHLEEYEYSVDYVITHTAPQRFIESVPEQLQWLQGCKTSQMLTAIEPMMTYKKWFFGHFHYDYIPAGSIAAWMYRDIVPYDTPGVAVTRGMP
jgi:hypothetical protein